MSNTEFDGRPLIAGSMIGLRSFKVDRLGRLTGASYETVWRPGENVAECAHDENASAAMRAAKAQLEAHNIRAALTSWHGGLFAPTATSSVVDKKRAEPKHRVAQLDCGCGFWAYFDTDGNPFHAADQVRGIVEGYGTVTAGSRGFRCEKARIVALIEDRERRPLRQRLTWLGWLDVALCLLNMLWLVASLAGVWPQAWWLDLLDGLAAGFLGANVYRHRHNVIRPRYTSNGISEQVRANYPGMPVYATLDDALAEHPLTPPPPLTPDTDPDFWTRSAS